MPRHPITAIVGSALVLVPAPRADAGCAGLPPVPGAGGTITWTASGGPYQVCENVTIPVGATVVVEAGAVITVDPGVTLTVDGTLLGQGTEAAPIELGPGGRVRAAGRLELDWTIIDAQLVPAEGATMLLRDCDFLADRAAELTTINELVYLWDDPPMVALHRCTFTGDFSAWEFLVQNAHLDLRDVAFTDTNVEIWDCYARLEQVDSTGGMINLFNVNVDAHQDLLVDGVAATGNASGPGVSITGANALLGPGNDLTGNLHPVAASGLLPGSVVPTTGNAQNVVAVTQRSPNALWSKVAVPWYYDETNGCSVLVPDIAPGVTVRMGPDAVLCKQGGDSGMIRGTPDAPIVFEPATGTPWHGIIFHVSGGNRLQNVVLDGAEFGVIATNAGAWMNDSLAMNCGVGANANSFGRLEARKTRFLGNDAGVEASDEGTMRLDNPDAPNAFEGNTVATVPFEILADIHAEHCWWGDPSGPTAASNPGGTGDAIGGPGTTHYQPFLTAAPNHDDHPPLVRLAKNERRPGYVTHALFETGSKFILEWTAEDDGDIVEQQVLFSEAGDADADFQVVATLPADRRAFEWTVPDVGFIVTGQSSFLRVVAVDEQGQAGWDEMDVLIPEDPPAGGAVTSDFGGMTFRAGAALPTITTTSPSIGTLNYFIVLDGDEQSIALGGGSTSWFFTDAPFASTDSARIAVRDTGSINRQSWRFGEPFSLRPDAEMGDAPPSVTLLSPAPGASYAGGTSVPIEWTASDDEGLHGFKLQASYDGGRTWHVIRRDLPATATSYTWPLPPSTGIDDVRVRVIAIDRRFQNSSDGGGAPFSILPGDGPADVVGDVDDDGTVDVSDLVALILAWGPCPAGACPADLDGSGIVDVSDLVMLILNWS